MVGSNVLDHPGIGEFELQSPHSGELDLRDFNAVQVYLRKYEPDMVIHAAGKVGGIQANISEPVSFLVENLDMGQNILLASREAGVKKLLNLGSSCMYPRNSPDALREEDVLSGALEPTNEGYAIAKCAIARLAAYIHMESPEFNYKTMIPCNLYGRYDKFHPKHSHLIPAIIHKLHHAKVNNLPVVEIWGSGNARREFMYAGDLADAIIYSINHFDTMPSLMNAGLGHDYSVNEYYDIAAKIVGFEGEFQHDLTKPVGMMRKLTDVSLAKQWGWQFRTSLEDGIRQAYSYYLESGVANELSVS